MRLLNRSWMMLVLAVLTAVAVGCNGSNRAEESPSTKGSGPGGTGQATAPGELPGGAVEVPAPEEKPPPPETIPKVVLDEATRNKCRVFVGDALPEGQLPDLQGQMHQLKEFFGKKLTVVVFWNADNLYGLQELMDLGRDVVEPYSSKGVSVVTVNVGNTPEETRAAVERARASLPVLADVDRSYFGKVATELLPRTYVIDAEGRILWFDTQYAPATSRSMLQTIRVVLGETGAE